MALMAWTSHLQDEEAKEKFLRKIANSKSVLSRLNDLVEEQKRVSESEMRKRDNFELPAWSEKQAYELGIQKALSSIQKLLKG